MKKVTDRNGEVQELLKALLLDDVKDQYFLRADYLPACAP
jgi:hypothetical protein